MGYFSYFDHDADIGICGGGESLESAFEAAAEAMFALMCESVPEVLDAAVTLSFEEEDVEFALVRWLNLLLAHAQARRLWLGRFLLERDGSHWYGRAWGTFWKAEMVRGVEVKGATLTMLHVTNSDGRWEACCIVDV